MNQTRIEEDSLQYLKQKRELFANEIRRAHRQEIIRAKRKIFIQQYLSSLPQNQQSELTTMPWKDLIDLLDSDKNTNQQQILECIALRLSSKSENIVFLISQLVESGKCSYLINNLENKTFMKQTLSIISVIMSKSNPRHAQIFVSKGIIEILLQLIVFDEFTGIVATILGNICIQSDDYCEMILANFKHELLINVFNEICGKFMRNQTTQNPEQSLKLILWLLGVVIATKESTLDFETQYDFILQFCRDLMQKRVLVNDVIQTVYELAVKNPTRIQSALYNTINSLIEQQTGQNQHLENILYLIQKLSPGRFNYNKIFQLIYISQYKIIKQIIYIVYKLQDSQYLNQLRKNQAWWEKVLIKLESKSQEFKIMLTVIKRLGISFPCVWRFISEFIDDVTYHKDVILDILIFLKNQLIAALQSMSQQSVSLLENLNKYKISKSLQKIYLKQNHQHSSRADQLMGLVDKLAKDLKFKYEIDVQI